MIELLEEAEEGAAKLVSVHVAIISGTGDTRQETGYPRAGVDVPWTPRQGSGNRYAGEGAMIAKISVEIAVAFAASQLEANSQAGIRAD